jgi:hypothetical protein
METLLSKTPNNTGNISSSNHRNGNHKPEAWKVSEETEDMQFAKPDRTQLPIDEWQLDVRPYRSF